VVLEFPSLEQAKRRYDSPEYRDLKALRLAATKGNPSHLWHPSTFRTSRTPRTPRTSRTSRERDILKFASVILSVGSSLQLT
jgi:hypothetical protein